MQLNRERIEAGNWICRPVSATVIPLSVRNKMRNMILMMRPTEQIMAETGLDYFTVRQEAVDWKKWNDEYRQKYKIGSVWAGPGRKAR